MQSAIHYLCSGCGTAVPSTERFPFRCPRAESEGEVDHLLTRVLRPHVLPSHSELEGDFSNAEQNPFVKYRQLLWSYHSALARGLSDERFVELVRALDDAIAKVDGRGFVATPFLQHPTLARELGVSRLWVKDDTVNVAGSHKARHLMGLMLALEVDRALGGVGEPAPLAIASCGNAALAAAVVARAAARALEVFVPAEADPRVVAALERRGAELTSCLRQPGEAGDPTVQRFRQALASGALPFTCQGPENGLVIEGGETLAFEMISELRAQQQELDLLVIQVGGGALATAVAGGFEEAHALGLVARLPRFCTVQTEGSAPLARAYDRVVARIVDSVEVGESCPAGRAGRAAWLLSRVSPVAIEQALRYAATHRSAFMWPWEQTPRSVASGILDDETYDWLAVVRAMLLTGGWPLVVAERTLREANELAQTATGIAVDATGSAGLAGYLALAAQGELSAELNAAVLFTGVVR